jgi:pSer/pThr/pTyr-binding forkhead associated (FHA) protein
MAPVNTGTDIKTCGRDPSCDLVLEHATLSRFHARLELADDGLVWVHDAGSSNGTFVNRNDQWQRIRKVTLCIGDRIRFGDVEVPLETLTAMFGARAKTRLEARRFPVRHGKTAARPSAAQADYGPVLNKPRRNPVTGKIEEERSKKNGP